MVIYSSKYSFGDYKLKKEYIYMYEPIIDFANIPDIPKSDIVLFHASSKHEMTTKEFDVNIFPLNTYAYSVNEDQWFQSVKEGTYIIALFWKKINSYEVPEKYLNFIHKKYKK